MAVIPPLVEFRGLGLPCLLSIPNDRSVASAKATIASVTIAVNDVQQADDAFVDRTTQDRARDWRHHINR